jgi:peptidoglycan/LPS O-acetylase OafA/YrhL
LTTGATKGSESHFAILDGWRGLSILAVLACHLLPLGPKAWDMNLAAGILGMAIFFCLSGFLITRFLLQHDSVANFLIRRLCRILPLAWLALIPALWMAHAGQRTFAPHFLFYANWPPFWLTDITAHYWSLCVEVQFYSGIAILFAVGGRRALKLLPLACLAITALRIHDGKYASIETYYRLDEILSGATLALIYGGEFGGFTRHLLSRVNPWIVGGLFLASTHASTQWLNYGRPYFAAALVGASMCRPGFPATGVLRTRTLAYIAEISYALYIVHPLLAATWLGSGGTVVRYAKRPLLFVAILGVAHLSTFYYESRWIALGKRWAARFSLRPKAAVAAS